MKHVKKIIISTGLACFLFMQTSLSVAGQGYIEKKGVRMPVKDTLVTYSKKDSTLSIFMFPSRLSSQDKREIAAKSNAFPVLWDKASPNSKKWQWYPYAMLQLRSRDGKFDSVDNISGYYLLAYGIEEKNFTDNINGYFSGKNTPDLYRKSGSRIKIRYEGENDYTKVKWDINISARIR